MTRPVFVAPSLSELEARLERRVLALNLPSLLVAHNLDIDAGAIAASAPSWLEPQAEPEPRLPPSAAAPAGSRGATTCFRVLDMCAAPGGKCFHVADRLAVSSASDCIRVLIVESTAAYSTFIRTNSVILFSKDKDTILLLSLICDIRNSAST